MSHLTKRSRARCHVMPGTHIVSAPGPASAVSFSIDVSPGPAIVDPTPLFAPPGPAESPPPPTIAPPGSGRILHVSRHELSPGPADSLSFPVARVPGPVPLDVRHPRSACAGSGHLTTAFHSPAPGSDHTLIGPQGTSAGSGAVCAPFSIVMPRRARPASYRLPKNSSRARASRSLIIRMWSARAIAEPTPRVFLPGRAPCLK